MSLSLSPYSEAASLSVSHMIFIALLILLRGLMETDNDPDDSPPTLPTAYYFEHYTAFMGRFLKHAPVVDYNASHSSPVVEVTFDGTKPGFDLAVGNVTSHPLLIEYGLVNTLPFIMKNISEVFIHEHLHTKPEVNIEHYGITLVKFVNKCSSFPLQDDIIFFDIGDFFDFINSETSKVEVRESPQPLSLAWLVIDSILLQTNSSAAFRRNIRHLFLNMDRALITGFSLAAVFATCAAICHLSSRYTRKYWK